MDQKQIEISIEEAETVEIEFDYLVSMVEVNHGS